MIKYLINVVSIPLSKHRYSLMELEERKNIVRTGQSGLLMQNFLKYQAEQDEASFSYSEYNNAIEQEKDPDKFHNATSDFDKSSNSSVTEEPERKKKKIRKISKRKFSIFEDINIEQEEKKEELLNSINADSYYDVIEPYDSEEREISHNRKKTVLIIGLIGILAFSILGIILLIRDMVS